ncbi:hypothetical protein JHU04_001562 [Brenneria sp. 4F2]|nr:hypothetical protein [Brenneria bubanii]
MKNYDIIYSIGRDCACSEYLKKNGLRICSGPFDWLTNAGFEERFTLLLNNFENFLNPEDFILLEKDISIENDNSCDYYKNVRTDFYFYHDFPTEVPFKDSFPDIAKKYRRRIQRFYDNVKNKKIVLLVWFSHYHNTSDEAVIRLCDSFCQKMERSIDFLIIEHSPNKKNHQIEIKNITNNIMRCSLYTITLDASGNITTLGNENSCHKIFSEYKLIIPLPTQLKKIILKLLKKIICFFIPIKGWRKKIRKSMSKKMNV